MWWQKNFIHTYWSCDSLLEGVDKLEVIKTKSLWELELEQVAFKIFQYEY